jgi:hypothetical protein
VKFSEGLALLAAMFFGAEKNTLAHDFSGFELHSRAGGDDDIMLGLVRIAAHAGFGQADFENTEVAEFNIAASGESIGDTVECELDDAENFLLGESSLLADLNYQIPFSEVGHISMIFG